MVRSSLTADSYGFPGGVPLAVGLDYAIMALGAIPFPNVSENLARCDVYDANSRGNAKYSRDAIRVFRDTNGEHCDCAVNASPFDRYALMRLSVLLPRA